MSESRFLDVLLVGTLVMAGAFRWIDAPLGFDDGTESRIYFAFLGGVILYLLLYAMTGPRRFVLTLHGETGLFLAWLLWTFVSGSTDDPFWSKGFWANFRNALLSAMTFLLVASMTARRGAIEAVFRGLAGCGLVLLAIGLQQGDLTKALLIREYRLGSGIGNSNEFGYVLLLSLIGAYYLLTRSRTLRGRVAVITCGALVGFGIILSGSRKAFLGALAFVVLAEFVSRRQRHFNRGLNWFIASLALFISYHGALLMVEDTFLGERISQIQSVEDLQTREENRLDKYRQAREMVAEAPLTGIGLGNFAKRSWSGSASHSDYVSAVTETGFVGAALYFGVYLALWIRVGRLLRRVRRAGLYDVAVTLAGFQTTVVVMLAVALGRWNFATPLHYGLLGGAVGYCAHVARRMERPAPTPAPVGVSKEGRAGRRSGPLPVRGRAAAAISPDVEPVR